MIRSFGQFIGENMDKNLDFIKGLALNLINKIKKSKKHESQEYMVFSGMEFTTPFMFDLVLNIRRDSDPNLEEDSHFNDLSWEELNYDDLGYAIDANVRMSKVKTMVPKIAIHIILNPKKEPLSYDNLYYRLVDILTHETNHLDQLGINRDPFNVNVSTKEEREKSKKSHKYFLLRDEIESMVEGMYVRSKEQGIPLDEVFTDYLTPFLKTGYVNDLEFQEVMVTWIRHAIELYPDAEFSSKARRIINSM